MLLYVLFVAFLNYENILSVFCNMSVLYASCGELACVICGELSHCLRQVACVHMVSLHSPSSVLVQIYTDSKVCYCTKAVHFRDAQCSYIVHDMPYAYNSNYA